MILPRLKGRHVPRFVANGDFASAPHIVMEKIEGQSLYERMQKGPIGLKKRWMEYARAIALAGWPTCTPSASSIWM